MKINTFEKSDRDDIIELVLHCQNDGTRPLVTVNDQPELLCIFEKFISCGGGFWVAKENDKLAGCIGLMKHENGIGILKKFFVYEDYRGAPHHLGQKLFSILIEFAKANGFKRIILDTPKNTDRAHKFYEKSGFKKITQNELGIEYNCPYKNSDFFLLEIL